jgi:hypothetical protein
VFGFGKKKDIGIEELAQVLIGKLQAQRADVKYRYDEAVDLVRGSDGSVINVGNVHAEYLNAPEKAREAVLDKFATIVKPPQAPKSLEEARPKLLAAFYNLHGLDVRRIAAGSADPGIATRSLVPFTNELGIGVVMDTETSMILVDDATLTQWGCTPQQALDVALANLKKRSPPKFTEISPGLFQSKYGDDYDAPRLLLPELIAQLPIKGAPLAMVPNRRCLLVAGDQDYNAVAAMVGAAARALQEPRPLGSEMLAYSQGKWLGIQPDGPIGKGLRNLRIQVRAQDYKAQQGVLDQACKAANLDIFVATYQLGASKENDVFGYCTLTRGVPTLLPKTDAVVLIEDPRAQPVQSKVVPWAEFEREAGHLLAAQPYSLPRYRVDSYPDAAAIERMAVMTFPA